MCLSSTTLRGREGREGGNEGGREGEVKVEERVLGTGYRVIWHDEQTSYL